MQFSNFTGKETCNLINFHWCLNVLGHFDQPFVVTIFKEMYHLNQLPMLHTSKYIFLELSGTLSFNNNIFHCMPVMLVMLLYHLSLLPGSGVSPSDCVEIISYAFLPFPNFLSYPLHHSWPDNPNNTWWGVKLLTVMFFPIYYQFLTLLYQYFYNFLLKHC